MVEFYWINYTIQQYFTIDHSTIAFIIIYSIFVCFQPLQVYVIDDTDPEEASYLGLAQIPLIPLAHDKPIKGTFELHRVSYDKQIRGKFNQHKGTDN